MNLFTKALVFAAHAHDGQLSDDGTPYILHPIAVAEMVMAKHGEEAAAVALLHDTVEDTDVSVQWVTGVFGERIGDAVRCITHTPGEPYMDYLERVATNHLALVVKLMDVYHNHFIRPPVADPKRRARLDAKYPAAIDFLEGRLSSN